MSFGMIRYNRDIKKKQNNVTWIQAAVQST